MPEYQDLDGYVLPTEQITASPGSMACLVVAAGGGLLPIHPDVIRNYTSGYRKAIRQDNSDFRTAPEFFASLGIVIGAESEIPGWHHCALPEGWHIRYNDAPGVSHDTSVIYLDRAGREMFRLIVLKQAGDDHGESRRAFVATTHSGNSFL